MSQTSEGIMARAGLGTGLNTALLGLLFSAGVGLYYLDELLQSNDDAVGELVNLRGNVTTRPDDIVLWSEADLGTSIFEGDTVATGPKSNALIALGENATITLGPNSQLKITVVENADRRSIDVNVLSGEVETKYIKPKAEQKQFGFQEPKKETLQLTIGDNKVAFTEQNGTVKINRNNKDESAIVALKSGVANIIDSRGRKNLTTTQTMTIAPTITAPPIPNTISNPFKRPEIPDVLADSGTVPQVDIEAPPPSINEAEAPRITSPRFNQSYLAFDSASLSQRVNVRLSWPSDQDRSSYDFLLKVTGSKSIVRELKQSASASFSLADIRKTGRSISGQSATYGISLQPGAVRSGRTLESPLYRDSSIQVEVTYLPEARNLMFTFDRLGPNRQTGRAILSRTPKGSQKRLMIIDNKKKSRLANLFDGNTNLTWATLPKAPEQGVFLGFQTSLIAFASGLTNKELQFVMQSLGAAFAFRGEKSSLLTKKQRGLIREYTQQGRKIHILQDKKLVPLNSNLILKSPKAVKFVTEGSDAIFIKGVEIVATR